MLYKVASGSDKAVDIPLILNGIRSRMELSQERLAQVLGISFVSVNRWERGASSPSPAQIHKILELDEATRDPWKAKMLLQSTPNLFASRGVRHQVTQSSLFDVIQPQPEVRLAPTPLPPILNRLVEGNYFAHDGEDLTRRIIHEHVDAAPTVSKPLDGGMSAGKNTYTYDAHTYHTKVPPQGIAELLKYYLPKGGLVFDAFSGSGMTGVASRVLGYDCILNELSPAACFISNRFTTYIDPALYEAGVSTVLNALSDLRSELYTTICRECGKPTELLYTVWSYNVLCSECGHEFLLWDHCRVYGKRVRDHKLLSEFPCPACKKILKKSRLDRTFAVPVQVGYKCCGSRQQEVTHEPNQADLELIDRLLQKPHLAEGYYPQNELPDGVNLQQPRNHGIDRIDRFYTPRNLAAMSHLWQVINRIEDTELAAHLAFTFTSLYQRVTRLSEFRFWGGSGNTARFNVPFIFNEANVFLTFARKARTIQDHLKATATHYRGTTVVVQNTATSLNYLPDSSIDLIFTDPPFGANINYSEMNILWESWLGRFTDTVDEAIVNRVQDKGIDEYKRLMSESLQECYRVLRPGHWMLLVFMNSSSKVWDALRAAIVGAGFKISQADIFDKQHGTFKQFVSDNTAGCDLVLHCLKPITAQPQVINQKEEEVRDSIFAFLETIDLTSQMNVFLHVDREAELDYRKLYSEWTANIIINGGDGVDFAHFRTLVLEWISETSRKANT